MAEEQIEVSLDQSIGESLAQMGNYDPGDDTRNNIVKAELEPLYRLHNEEKKVDNSFEVEMEKLKIQQKDLEAKNELEREKLEFEKVKHSETMADHEADRKIKKREITSENVRAGVDATLKVAGTGVGIWFISEVAYFEQNNIFRSKALNLALKNLKHIL